MPDDSRIFGFTGAKWASLGSVKHTLSIVPIVSWTPRAAPPCSQEGGAGESPALVVHLRQTRQMPMNCVRFALKAFAKSITNVLLKLFAYATII